MSDKLIQQILNVVMEIKEELNGVKLEQAGIKQEIGGIKNDISGMKQEIDGIKNEQTAIKQEISGIKQEQETTNEHLSSLQSKQDLIYNQTCKLTEYHEEKQEKFERLATINDLKYYDTKIGEHDREIYNLKNN